MLRKPALSLACGVVATGIAGAAHASVLDGSLTPGEGYGSTPLVTQTNVTTSPSSDGGGQGGPTNEATATNTSRLNQLSNAYAYIDTTTTPTQPVLHLFIGGSLANIGGQDTKIELALQAGTGGVTSLAGQNLNGNLPDVKFQGFSPTALYQFSPFSDNGGGTAGDGGTLYKDLRTASSGTVAVNSNHTGTDNSTFGIATNNALVTTAVGAGGTGDPGFAGANTGIELTIPLTSITAANTGYTGGDLKAFLFFSVGGDNRTNNQLLSPFVYNPNGGGYDYTYIDTSSGVDPNARQFGSALYPVAPGGSQYFTIPGATPEPASLSLLALGGMAVLRRRRN